MLILVRENFDGVKKIGHYEVGELRVAKDITGGGTVHQSSVTRSHRGMVMDQAPVSPNRNPRTATVPVAPSRLTPKRSITMVIGCPTTCATRAQAPPIT